MGGDTKDLGGWRRSVLQLPGTTARAHIALTRYHEARSQTIGSVTALGDLEQLALGGFFRGLDGQDAEVCDPVGAFEDRAFVEDTRIGV